jgi:uncharacterized protein (DUF58 family)
VNPGPSQRLSAEMAERLRHFTLSVRRPVQGPRQGLHRSPAYGASVEFAEYREYAPGDPPGMIDWAVYARSDRYMVRRYLEETNLRAWVLLDTSESLAFRQTGRLSKLDYAATLAAGLLLVLVNQGDSAALATFDSDLRLVLPGTSSHEGLTRHLHALDEVKAAGQGDIERALHALADRLDSRHLVIVISDFLEPPEKILRGLWRLHHERHAVLALHVLDGGELTLGAEGAAELRELETGARMSLEADTLRTAYAREVQRYLEELRLGCAACLTEYHLVDTRLPVEEHILKLS